MATDMKVIAVIRAETRRGDPMWTLQTTGGDRINAFDNLLQSPPWMNSGYRTWFEAMESGQTDRWVSWPIWVGVAKPCRYWEVVSVQPTTPGAKLDKSSRPRDVWELYGQHWRHTLYCSLCLE